MTAIPRPLDIELAFADDREGSGTADRRWLSQHACRARLLSLPGSRGMPCMGSATGPMRTQRRIQEWPALDILASANFACNRQRFSSYRPCSCRRPLRPPPVPGPSTARSFAGRRRRAPACTCSRTCAGALRCRPYWPSSRWVVPWPHGWKRPRSAGPRHGRCSRPSCPRSKTDGLFAHGLRPMTLF